MFSSTFSYIVSICGFAGTTATSDTTMLPPNFFVPNRPLSASDDSEFSDEKSHKAPSEEGATAPIDADAVSDDATAGGKSTLGASAIFNGILFSLLGGIPTAVAMINLGTNGIGDFFKGTLFPDYHGNGTSPVNFRDTWKAIAEHDPVAAGIGIGGLASLAIVGAFLGQVPFNIYFGWLNGKKFGEKTQRFLTDLCCQCRKKIQRKESIPETYRPWFMTLGRIMDVAARIVFTTGGIAIGGMAEQSFEGIFKTGTTFNNVAGMITAVFTGLPISLVTVNSLGEQLPSLIHNLQKLFASIQFSACASKDDITEEKEEKRPALSDRTALLSERSPRPAQMRKELVGIIRDAQERCDTFNKEDLASLSSYVENINRLKADYNRTRDLIEKSGLLDEIQDQIFQLLRDLNEKPYPWAKMIVTDVVLLPVAAWIIWEGSKFMDPTAQGAIERWSKWLPFLKHVKGTAGLLAHTAFGAGLWISQVRTNILKGFMRQFATTPKPIDPDASGFRACWYWVKVHMPTNFDSFKKAIDYSGGVGFGLALAVTAYALLDTSASDFAIQAVCTFIANPAVSVTGFAEGRMALPESVGCLHLNPDINRQIRGLLTDLETSLLLMPNDLLTKLYQVVKRQRVDTEDSLENGGGGGGGTFRPGGK